MNNNIKKKVTWNKGIKHSEETRKKISESCKRVGVGKWNKGLKRYEVSELTRKKRSKSMKRFIKNNKEKWLEYQQQRKKRKEE